MGPSLPPPDVRRGSLLWILDLAPGPNGATLRFLHFSKCLREAGFSVHFAVSAWSYDQDQLDGLVKEGWIDGFSKLNTYRAVGARNALSRVFLLPSLRNWIMEGVQAPAQEELLDLVRRCRATVCVISNKDSLFSVRALARTIRVVIDWCDCATLYYWRALVQSIRSRSWKEIPERLGEGLRLFLIERYYPKLAHANIVVSPADQRAFQRICPGAADLRVVLNGVDSSGKARGGAKIKDRLIFSGRMDFPPNYEGALWFIDHVLPVLRKRNPSLHLVLAGAHPALQLKSRESDFIRITGFVPDMCEELARASLYVAPLISGTGFKNKVFEALAAGTAVVGTPFAAEFLPVELNQVVRVARSAEEFADTVLKALEHPDLLEQEVAEAQRFLELNCSWQARTRDLLALVDPPEASEGAPRAVELSSR